MIDPDHYKIVIFAMTINIVIAAGKTALDYDYASLPLMTAWSLLYVKLGMFLSSKDLQFKVFIFKPELLLMMVAFGVQKATC